MSGNLDLDNYLILFCLLPLIINKKDFKNFTNWTDGLLFVSNLGNELIVSVNSITTDRIVCVINTRSSSFGV